MSGIILGIVDVAPYLPVVDGLSVAGLQPCSSPGHQYNRMTGDAMQLALLDMDTGDIDVIRARHSAAYLHLDSMKPVIDPLPV